ncbi:hypothetical protein [Neptunomonas qingdaonensis]|uniref:Uncharacterized protein n=1 Tax=Neptunomonas qingdaonensis TaxID=1045558 RepID=A0A1I2QDD0_9GAMM|nr:hypothetical protein [Neptunomonas qingdaonensis]SFG23621.1 hypothetical protein SAMN05216175_104245 [Neptunomonas qingdaonensis]
MLPRIASILSLMMIFGIPIAYSKDFKIGLKVAQVGGYDSALLAWKPLAEQGYAAQYNSGVNSANVQGDKVTANDEDASNKAKVSIRVNEVIQANSQSVVHETLLSGITSYSGSFQDKNTYLGKVTPPTEIPYGDLAALKLMKLLPEFDISTYTRNVNTSIDWSGNTGERPEIGLFPDDHAAFIAGVDVNIELINATADQAMPSTFSFGHFPNLYWLPYLMTGDAKYIAHMEDQYIRVTSKMGVPVNEFANWYESGRYFAWSLRNLAQLAYLQQKGLTTQTYYIDALNFTKTYLTNKALNNSDPAYDTWRVLKFNSTTYKSVGFTGWQESMMGIVINYVAQLGFTDWLPICKWHFVQLQRRIDYWGWKAVDADHLWFYERASELGQSAEITNYGTARAWAAKAGETVKDSWERVTPYPLSKMNVQAYIDWPEGKLLTVNGTVGGQTFTYANRAQYAAHWAAMAARNGIDGADIIADALHEKINDRGDVWDYKNNPSGYPYTVELTPISNFNWTPGRNADGIVVDASWQQLPIATKENPIVHRITGSDPVGELTSDLISKGFNPASDDYGNGKVAGTFYAWVGQALDPVQKKAWIPWGGGHADSSMNGVWELDINKLKWSVESMPSDPDALGYEWSDSYKNSGSFTKYHGGYTLPDGRPPSQHTYGGVFKSGDWLVTTRNRRFAYNIVTKEYKIEEWSRNGAHITPDIHNYAFAYGDVVYGALKQANEWGGWHKIPDPSKPEVVNISAPSYDDINWNGGHALTQIGFDKIIAIGYKNRYQIFDMAAESWGPVTYITGDTPSAGYGYENELQGLVYIPNWGASGSILRQYMYGSSKGKWFVLDLETNIQTAIALEGSPIQYTPWVGQKVFTIEIGGITAMIYTSVRSGVSQTSIMRIE